MATQRQFLDLLIDIEPSPTTVQSASSAHSDLRSYIRTQVDYRDIHLDTFLAGSYRRQTSIRPRMVDGVVSRPDIDIIVVTNHTLSDSPADVLKLLRDTLGEEYELKQPPNARSVGVTSALADMDVVPIIAPGGLSGTNYIPDRTLEEWLETNPDGHTTWSTEVNQAAGDRFKPLVKLVKWWRRQNPTISIRPKGFVIECIVATCMDRGQANYPELFVGLLERIVDRYASYVGAGMVPWIADPGVPGNSVTTRLTYDAFEAFYNKAKAHAELGCHAIEEDDPDRELSLWRKIFGDRFPAPASATAAKSLLGAAAIPTRLSFPNHPIVPRKPGGFA